MSRKGAANPLAPRPCPLPARGEGVAPAYSRVAAISGPRGAAFARQRDLKAPCRADPALAHQGDCEAIVRTGRSAAQERRSRGRMLRIRLDLTATGRRGPRQLGI
jgi:hypothetical protein